MLWLIALLLAIPAAVRTATLYLHLNSELEALLPRESPSVQAIEELRRRVEGLQYLGVVVDVGDSKNLEAAGRFIDDLAARIRAYPPDLVRSVRTGDDQERKFLEEHAALYVDVGDLDAIDQRITARRDYEVSKELGSNLEEDQPPPPLDFSDIEQKYQERLPKGGKDEGGRYASRELGLAMLLVEVGQFTSGSEKPNELLTRVQNDAQALGGTDRYASGMRVGYAGDVAISVEETTALMSDLSISSLLVVLAVVGVLLAYYRWWKSIVVLVPPLLLATLYSFAVASLPPFRVTELNSNTAFLGSIIVGNGINFGIILLARYLEERRRGQAVHEALVVGVWGARTGTLSASLAAGVSYGSLILTQFRGFRQFGYIGAIGMVVCWAVSFTLMPPLIAWLDKGKAPQAVDAKGRAMEYLARFVGRYPFPIVLVATTLSVASLWTVREFSFAQLETDFSKLRRADTWVSGEGYWGERMDELLGAYLTPTVILADEPEQAARIADAVREAAKRRPLDVMVSSVRTLSDVLPPDQETKIDKARAIREAMTPKLRSLVAPDKREVVDRLLGKEDLRPVSLSDLPRTFTAGTRERDGSFGRTVLVFPRPSKSLWQGEPLAQYVAALRAVAAEHPSATGPPARVAGSLALSTDILASVAHDGPLASAAAFAGVVAVVLALFRWDWTTLQVIAALVTGVLWLAGATIGFGIKINFANFIAFPITFGIGVDYAVNVVSRYVLDGEDDVLAAVRSTGGAVALCSATTIIGYSSLLVAENRALYLFGLVAVVGEFACLTAAVTVLPAVLLLLQRWRGALTVRRL